jgi:hypothetical protein
MLSILPHFAIVACRRLRIALLFLASGADGGGRVGEGMELAFLRRSPWGGFIGDGVGFETLGWSI